MKKTAGQMGVGGRGKALRPAAGRMRGERMKHEKELRELSDMVDNLYIHGRLMRSGENKPRYYGSDILLFPNEVYTLKAIAQEEGINQTELSEKMFRTKGATSAVVQKLVQKGLVIQVGGETDSRISRLYPTEKGRQVYKNHLEYDMRYLEYLSKRLHISLEELAQVNRVLRLMNGDFIQRRREGENIVDEWPGELPPPPQEE